jgi:hypothetical protein
MIYAGGEAHALYDDFATIQHTTISQFTPHLCHFFHFSETTHPFVNPLHHPPSTMAPSLMSNTNADNNNAMGIPPPVWLPTPRPMTNEELAMPMTAAPTNKGASEMGPSEPSDSGDFSLELLFGNGLIEFDVFVGSD